jgi:hypothetical protein
MSIISSNTGKHTITAGTELNAHLLLQHQALITNSAISREVAIRRGYQSIDNPRPLGNIGFAHYQRQTPGLLIPIWNVDGKIATYQFRPDNPRTDRRGKFIKYETPEGHRLVIDVPPQVRSQLDAPDIPLLITEGVRKADAAISAGKCCIDLLRVWGWRGTNDHGGKTALPDWHSIALNGRETFLCFDSDMATNSVVRGALKELGRFLQSKGAKVWFCDLSRGGPHE